MAHLLSHSSSFARRFRSRCGIAFAVFRLPQRWLLEFSGPCRVVTLRVSPFARRISCRVLFLASRIANFAGWAPQVEELLADLLLPSRVWTEDRVEPVQSPVSLPTLKRPLVQASTRRRIELLPPPFSLSAWSHPPVQGPKRQVELQPTYIPLLSPSRPPARSLARERAERMSASISVPDPPHPFLHASAKSRSGARFEEFALNPVLDSMNSHSIQRSIRWVRTRSGARFDELGLGPVLDSKSSRSIRCLM